MGNAWHNWGIIHNKSKEDIFFIIHKQGQNPYSHISQIVYNQKLNVEQAKKLIYEVFGGYLVPSGRLVTAGLDYLSFNGKQYISIIRQNGIMLISAGKIKSVEDIRLKIREDFSYGGINQQISKHLKTVAQGQKIQLGRCPACQSASDQIKTNKELKCNLCRFRDQRIWVCQKEPQRHNYCQRCFEISHAQSQLESMEKSPMKKNVQK